MTLISKSMQQSLSSSVSRRHFLRAAGATLALPWLESMPLRAEDTGKRVVVNDAEAPTTHARPYSNGLVATSTHDQIVAISILTRCYGGEAADALTVPAEGQQYLPVCQGVYRDAILLVDSTTADEFDTM